MSNCVKQSGSHTLPFPGLGVVIAAGGSGARFGADKLLAEIAGKPVIAWSAAAFASVCAPGLLVVAAPADRMDAYRYAITRHCPNLSPVWVIGGITRPESVLTGLDALPAKAVMAAVHDAARPLACLDLIFRCASSCVTHGSGVAARKASDTIKTAGDDGIVIDTLDRSRVWLAETPQIFPRQQLADAYRVAIRKGVHPTDEAGAMELAGHCVRLVVSAAPNPKITFPEDISVAAALFHHNRIPPAIMSHDK